MPTPYRDEQPAHDRPCVLHVDSERGFSGGEEQVFLLVEGLCARGWRNVIACRPDSATSAEAAARGIEVRHAPMRNDVDVVSVAALCGAIRATAADLVHLHTGRSTWLGGLASRLAGIPATTTRRMDRPVRRNWRTRMVYDKLVQRVVAISPAVKTRLTDAGIAASRVSVIASAVDANRLRPTRARRETRQALHAGDDDVVVLVLAALVPRKGVDLLLQALGMLAREGMRPLAWIAGDGPQRARLETQAAELGLHAQVWFLGHRRDVADLLAGCDMLAVPSRREGLGVAALEAMAAGRPVIASAVGGLADAILDRQTGLLVAPDDAGALARAIAEVGRDPGLRSTLGEAGARRVAEAFSAEQMVESYVRLYRDLLEEWKNRRDRA